MSKREPYPSEVQDRFIVRLPDGMRDRIKAAAEANNRSMNAEIVSALEEKFPAHDPIGELLDKAIEVLAYTREHGGDQKSVTERARNIVDEARNLVHASKLTGFSPTSR